MGRFADCGSARQSTRLCPVSRQGWVPRQHGVWAMLIVPFVTGVVLRARVAALDLWLVPLWLAVLAAYLCFNVLTFWLRAAPARRSTYTRPLLVYGAVAAVFGTLALLMGAWPMLAWLPFALPFAVLAVWLAAQRKDRTVASGFATLVLAVGTGLAVRFVTPAGLLAELPAAAPDVWIITAQFVYFFGTVWHVKALIRQRGQARARWRSIGWHLGATLAAVAGTTMGAISPLWIGFFVATTARTWWMTRPDLAPRIKPIQIGIMEITLSVFALACSLL